MKLLTFFLLLAKNRNERTSYMLLSPKTCLRIKLGCIPLFLSLKCAILRFLASIFHLKSLLSNASRQS